MCEHRYPTRQEIEVAIKQYTEKYSVIETHPDGSMTMRWSVELDTYFIKTFSHTLLAMHDEIDLRDDLIRRMVSWINTTQYVIYNPLEVCDECKYLKRKHDESCSLGKMLEDARRIVSRPDRRGKVNIDAEKAWMKVKQKNDALERGSLLIGKLAVNLTDQNIDATKDALLDASGLLEWAKKE